jgi:hypothetical protein
MSTAKSMSEEHIASNFIVQEHAKKNKHEASASTPAACLLLVSITFGNFIFSRR